MPTILRLEGFRYHFYVNEGDEPPHIHIIGKGGEMKVWLHPILVESSYNLSPADQRRVFDAVKKHKALFLEKWNEFAARKN